MKIVGLFVYYRERFEPVTFGQESESPLCYNIFVCFIHFFKSIKIAKPAHTADRC
ncbi:MAG: hypothetical protein IJY73_09240 [Oscillospiraceae bacterium]|nr:hypothetical protein [Oscillospiraceae bacterium]